MQRVFIDASVLVAACGNPTGGSAKILEIVQKGYFRGVVSEDVVAEARRAVAEKMPEPALVQFYQYLGEIDFDIARATGALPAKVRAVFPPKDRHVISAALNARAEIIFTLDQKNFLNEGVRALKLPFAIMTPKMFFQKA